MDTVKISVRRLVEFILCAGDIRQGGGVFGDADAMQEGSRIHKKIQKQGGAGYRAEVSMKMDIPVDDGLVIALEGRADGIIEEYQEEQSCMCYTIDEIKGTYGDLRKMEAPVMTHLGQALCYAYMLSCEKKLEEIQVQLTYVHIESEKVRRFNEKWNFGDLEQWFMGVIREYAKWARWQLNWRRLRNASIGAASFPFEYRPGQKKLVSGVYQTIIRGKNLFIQAPTGTGKTISTIFPAVKVMGEGRSDKIFYLTAKTITRTVACETYSLLHSRGLDFKYVVLTAKDKCCIFDEPKCNPVDCPRARGHFDRVNDAVFDLINHECAVTAAVIDAYAEKHNVCPFEMQLDVSLWMDSVICDYNYVFDPYVYLKRFFGDTKENYIFLIDEAHNLVERAREMYSASLTLSHFKNVRKMVTGISIKMTVRIGKCIKYLQEVRENCEDCEETNKSSGATLYLMRMMAEMEEFFKDSQRIWNWDGSGHQQETAPVYAGYSREELGKIREAVLDLYMEAKQFVNAYDCMEENRYIEYGKHIGDADFIMKIYCIDPSKDLSLRTVKGLSAIFFSATLLPIRYYKELLSASHDEDYDLYANSPFSFENRLLLAASDVSSRYTRRGLKEYERIAGYIRDIVRAKNGNYLVFFPSYAFMQSVYDIFCDRELMKAGSSIKVIIQENTMTEQERQAFLDAFVASQQTTMIGFCVLGGIFSEGIDLKEDRLIGAIIVGTGLPQVGEERELLKKFFDQRSGMGFEYAYLYPGMNKVLQAGGRVIRTENDKGVIALLDERFNYRQYRDIFPREWSGCLKVRRDTLMQPLNDFWEHMTGSSN